MPSAPSATAFSAQSHKPQDPQQNTSHTPKRRSLHTHLSHLFSPADPSPEEDEQIPPPETGAPTANCRHSNFLRRAHDYAHTMHTHTRLQLGAPATDTLPSYTKTMHAFTLNQLDHTFDDDRRGRTTTATRSAMQGPHFLGAATAKPRETVAMARESRAATLPHKVCADLSNLSLDETLTKPADSSGRHGEVPAEVVLGIDMSKLRKPSLTDPIPRDYAVGAQQGGLRSCQNTCTLHL